jgi:uncharacterized protein involved in exopolysaccharide biosynthesis
MSTVQPDRDISNPSVAPAASAAPRETAEVTLYDLINMILRHRRLIVALPIVLAAVVGTYAMTRSRTYASTASFMPQATENGLSKLGGLAAQFGLSVGGGNAGQSAPFYADLVQSREILGPVVDSTYTTVLPGKQRRGTLTELLEVDAPSAPERRAAAIQILGTRLEVTPQLETGVVRLRVTASDPALAQQIVQHVLDEVSAFNLRRRRAQAAAERVFLEERLGELRSELREAEQRKASFLERNREYRNAPQLYVVAEQLDRDVSMRQAVFTSFAQAYEQAKIDEVRNTPLVTIVERPEAPTGPLRRRALTKSIVAALVGGVLAVMIAIGIEFFRRASREDPEGAAQFVELKAQLTAPLRRKRT